MADDRVNLPAGFGGLVRFNEEYSSYFNVKPIHVIIFVALIIGLRIAFQFIF